MLTHDVPEFDLLETMLHEPASGYFLLEEHLRRLAESAEYFDFAVELAAIRESLRREASGFENVAQRVRLRVARDGRFTIEATPLPAADTAAPWRLKVAREPVDSHNVLLYHKTTCREPYDAARASRSDCDDVVLWNECGQATETTIGNLVIEKSGRRVTPPVGCGLLPGVFLRT